MHRVAARRQKREERVSRLVVRGPLAIRRIEQKVSDRPERDLLQRFREILGAYRAAVLACRQQRRFVHQVA